MSRSESGTPDRERAAPLASGEFHVPSLEGVHGRIEFRSPLGRVHVTIADGKVTLSPPVDQTDCVLESDIEGELLRLVRGESNLVTALLQGRVQASGDPMLAVRIAGSRPTLGDKLREQAAGGR
jgi:putative sterol carrier protein